MQFISIRHIIIKYLILKLIVIVILILKQFKGFLNDSSILIGFIVGCFSMNMEAQAKINDLNKLVEEKENKINEQYVELDSLRETIYMYNIYGK